VLSTTDFFYVLTQPYCKGSVSNNIDSPDIYKNFGLKENIITQVLIHLFIKINMNLRIGAFTFITSKTFKNFRSTTRTKENKAEFVM